MSKLSLLILDEDAYYAGIFASRFEDAGWKVKVAESIEDARNALKKDVPNAIILDTEPFEQAIDFIQELRQAEDTSEVVVMVLTELGNRDQIQKAKNVGADGYFLKGHFFPSEAISKLRRLVEEVKK